jgi:N-sulfoglucosamine sulfohydrolase
MGRKERTNKFWQLNFGMRPAEELYDLTVDAGCARNLAGESVHAERVNQLRERMESELKVQNDPRMAGNGKIFDEYPATNGAGFYEKFMRGEKMNAGWVTPTDFEKEPIQQP